MIKLNNKNITYVALADSNNSLKAPKEIWYADSSNSVKLVYRRKDALIEGEDYEKYHWLKTTEYAYINTKIKGNQNSNVEVIAIQYTNPTAYALTLYGSVPSDVNRAISFNVSTVSSGRNTRFGNRALLLGDFNTNQEYDVVQNKDTLIVNGITLSNVQATNIFESDEIYVFASNITDDITSYLNRGLSIRKFVISNVINLVPCKLLKPVPKWLDANGIRRQVGECGMIDLVSGKFYGNVNNVGTFTVENYYESKELLKGDGSAYIDTNITSVNRIKFTVGTSGTNDWTTIAYTHATNEYAIALQNNQIYAYFIGTSPNPLSFYVDENRREYTIDIDCINGVLSVPETEQSGSKQFTTSFSYTHKFKPTQGIRLKDISLDSMHLIPCTLTMDLPASMDANNIARTKGTSGMWDLVSDRFYGNVANSGTFKAVNLAEGVDYEVHDWLIGDGSTRIKVIGNIYRDTFSVVTIPTTTTNKRLLDSMGTTHDGNTTEYQIMVGGANEFSIRHGIRINNNPTAILKIFTDNYINNEYEITTYRDGDYYYGNINGVEYKNNRNFGEYQFADEDIVINIYSNGFKLGNFNSGRVDLIPVKLLRSIPAKYDANGIARQAGECGMYDTVNDVFYGNVASSGTFSVSDDS